MQDVLAGLELVCLPTFSSSRSSTERVLTGDRLACITWTRPSGAAQHPGWCMRCTCSHVRRALRPCSGNILHFAFYNCDACISMQGSTSFRAALSSGVQQPITAHQNQHLWGLPVASVKDNQRTGHSLLHMASATDSTMHADGISPVSRMTCFGLEGYLRRCSSPVDSLQALDCSTALCSRHPLSGLWQLLQVQVACSSLLGCCPRRLQVPSCGGCPVDWVEGLEGLLQAGSRLHAT